MSLRHWIFYRRLAFSALSFYNCVYTITARIECENCATGNHCSIDEMPVVLFFKCDTLVV